MMDSSHHRVEVVPATFEARIIGSGPHAVRVLVSGELDLVAAPELEAALRRALSLARDVILDLADVRFIDSTGLYAIVGAVREARTSGIELRISATLHPQVARLFEIVGLTDTLPLAEV